MAEGQGDGAAFGRLKLDKTFHGDLQGTSVGEMMTAGTAVEGSAGYVAIERVTGSLAGRAGSFVLLHRGTMQQGAFELSIVVVPDSGTGQLAGLAWNELKRHAPERLEVLRRLLSVGFSPALSRQIVEHMPQGYSTERGMKWARTALQHNLPTVGPGADIVEAGGVYALVGPTGVGKTTTVAKLAARATLRHGAAKVALITTDGRLRPYS